MASKEPTFEDTFNMETDQDGNTTFTVIGSNEDGEDSTTYVVLSPNAIARLAGRLMKQSIAAAIVGSTSA